MKRLFHIIAAAAVCLIAAPAIAQTQAPIYKDRNGNYQGAQGVIVLNADGSATNANGATAQTIQGNFASGSTDGGNPVKVGCVYLATPTSVSNGQRVNSTCTAQGFNYVVEAADASSISGTISVVSAAVSAGVVGKASPGNLYGYNVVSGASAGYVLIRNATAVAADGAVTPVRCIPIAANTGIDVSLRGQPVYFATGITVEFSTTGCFTKTGSATAFIAVDVR